MRRETYSFFTDLGQINVSREEFDRVLNNIREFEEIEQDELYEPEIGHEAIFYTKKPYGFIASCHFWN